MSKRNMHRYNTKEYQSELNNLFKNNNKLPFQSDHIMLSVENPYHPSTNRLSTDDTIKFLKSINENAKKISGKYGSEENSIFIQNPRNIPLLFNIAKAAGQDSVLYSNGKNHELHFVNGNMEGKHLKGIGTVVHKERPNDYYSTININGGDVHFSHNLDTNSLFVQKDSEIEHKIQPPKTVKSEPLQKPFQSKAQQKFAYANPEKFGGKEGLKHWQAETPKDIPNKKSEELDSLSEDNLEKAVRLRPTKEDQVDEYTGDVAKIHQNGNLMWHAGPGKAAKHDQILQNQDLINNYMKSFQHETHKNVFPKIIQNVLNDPNRHFIPTEENGSHRIRARHIKSLLLGDSNYKIDLSDPNKLSITALKRHGSNEAPTTWTYNITQKGANNAKLQRSERFDARRSIRDCEVALQFVRCYRDDGGYTDYFEKSEFRHSATGRSERCGDRISAVLESKTVENNLFKSAIDKVLLEDLKKDPKELWRYLQGILESPIPVKDQDEDIQMPNHIISFWATHRPWSR